MRAGAARRVRPPARSGHRRRWCGRQPPVVEWQIDVNPRRHYGARAERRRPIPLPATGVDTAVVAGHGTSLFVRGEGVHRPGAGGARRAGGAVSRTQPQPATRSGKRRAEGAAAGGAQCHREKNSAPRSGCRRWRPARCRSEAMAPIRSELMRKRRLVAGAPGFEPGNGGIKIRCLTTWLRPIASVRQRGRTILRPASPINAFMAPLRHPAGWRRASAPRQWSNTAFRRSCAPPRPCGAAIPDRQRACAGRRPIPQACRRGSR